MYSLRRFHGTRYDRINAIIDSLSGHLTSYVNVIGSASLPLPDVIAMQGLPGTACRTEGHRDARVFPATDAMDLAESLIEERMRELFGLGGTYSVSGQPHSATHANQAAFRAVLDGCRGLVAGLSPSAGGHISHRFGAPPGHAFLPIPLGVDGIDYEALELEVQRRKPTIIVAGATSYTRAIDYGHLRHIANSVGCHLHADLAHTAPFVAAGLHPPVFPYADSATIDTSKNLRGPRGGILVYRDADGSNMRRAIFPLQQSSPNQDGLLGKAACLHYWSRLRLRPYAEDMLRLARVLADELADRLGNPVFGGTDTHLLLFDLTRMSVSGLQAETALEQAGILVNRNQIPGDSNSPWAPSGIRLGTTALAVLGYTDDDVRALGSVIGRIICGDRHDAETVARLLATYHRPLVSTASEPTSSVSTASHR